MSKYDLEFLNQTLFEALDNLDNENLSQKEIEKLQKKAKVQSQIASMIIKSKSLQLDAIKFKTEYSNAKDSVKLITGED